MNPSPSAEPFGLFEAVVQRLVEAGGDKLKIRELTRGGCACTLERALFGVDILVLKLAPDTTEGHLERVRALMKAPKPRGLDIVLVGGGSELLAPLKATRPMMTNKRVGILHIREDRTSWKSSVNAVSKLLGDPREVNTSDVDETSWERLVADSAASRGAFEEQGVELHQFATTIRKRRVWATLGLAALIACVFALQLFVGFDTPPQLVRMGALSRARVLEGEVWRLLSCTVLHGGWMHAAVNTYVLIALGVFLERIIGPARLVLLYVASALAGSIGSVLLLGDGMSVGASGAVWGLLGAHAVLAFRPAGLLPEAMVAGAKKAALFNLVINAANSFQPHVDMWAHFAGGAAGALLFVTVLTRGVPRLPSVSEESGGVPASVPSSKPISFAAGVSIALLPVSIGIAVLTGSPFALRAEPELTAVSIEALGVELSLPANLEMAAAAPEDRERVFGEPLRDPAFIGVFALELPALTPEAQEAEMVGLIASLEPAETSTPVASPRRFEVDGDPGVLAEYVYPNGLRSERAFRFLDQKLVRVEVYRWPGLEAAPRGMAERLVRTAQLIR